MKMGQPTRHDTLAIPTHFLQTLAAAAEVISHQ